MGRGDAPGGVDLEARNAAHGQQRMEAVQGLVEEVGQAAVGPVNFVRGRVEVEGHGQPGVDILAPAEQVDARIVLAAVAQARLARPVRTRWATLSGSHWSLSTKSSTFHSRRAVIAV